MIQLLSSSNRAGIPFSSSLTPAGEWRENPARGCEVFGRPRQVSALPDWKLTGYEWDAALHQKAIELYTSGQLALPESTEGRSITITVDDLKN